MKRLLLALALFLIPSMAFGQCNGVFPNNTVCGNSTGASNLPKPTSAATFSGLVGGTNGQTQYNNSGALGGYTPSGDVAVVPSTGVETIQPNAVTNSKLAQMGANSDKCNPTNASANAQDCQLGMLHSKDFGAVGNGSTDDTTNLQTWVTACQTRLLVCYLDSGTYKISSALSITGYIYLTGAGRLSAILAPSNATQNTFTINTTAGYGQIQNISNQPSVTKTGGAFISLTSPGANNQFWTFRDLSTNGNDFNGFSFGAVSNFTLDNVLEPCLNICVGTGVTGDSVITNSIFQPAANNAVAISIGINGSSSANGSGLRIVNNKINSGNTGVIGIQLFGTALCASCSDLMIANNSIEVLGNAILLGPANSATSYVNITIVGNELNGNAGVNNTDSTTWLGSVTITGNIIVPIAGPGINLQNVKNFIIEGNVFTGVSGANFGINLSALVTGCVIGPNQFSGVTTNFADASNACTVQAGSIRFTNSLGADVLLNNTANYFDGPSVAQGTAVGPWFASGTVTIFDTAAAIVFCKLWDGTTVIASASNTLAASSAINTSLSGVITSPAANIRISCRDSSNTTGKILFNNTGNSKDATITAFRLQ